MMGIENVNFFVCFILSLMFLSRKVKVSDRVSVPYLLSYLFACLGISFLKKAKCGNLSRKPERTKSHINVSVIQSQF